MQDSEAEAYLKPNRGRLDKKTSSAIIKIWEKIHPDDFLSHFCTIDIEILEQYSNTKILVIHDAFGLFEAICKHSGSVVKYFGLPDRYCCFYGTLEEIRKELGLDVDGIKKIVSKCSVAVVEKFIT